MGGRVLLGSQLVSVSLVVVTEFDEELPHVIEAFVLWLIEGGLDTI